MLLLSMVRKQTAKIIGGWGVSFYSRLGLTHHNSYGIVCDICHSNMVHYLVFLGISPCLI